MLNGVFCCNDPLPDVLLGLLKMNRCSWALASTGRRTTVSVYPPPVSAALISCCALQYSLLARRCFSATPQAASACAAPGGLKAWKLGRLNHVAIAVPDLEKATSLYRDVMGAEVSEVQVWWVWHEFLGNSLPYKKWCRNKRCFGMSYHLLL